MTTTELQNLDAIMTRILWVAAYIAVLSTNQHVARAATTAVADNAVTDYGKQFRPQDDEL